MQELTLSRGKQKLWDHQKKAMALFIIFYYRLWFKLSYSKFSLAEHLIIAFRNWKQAAFTHFHI